MSELRLDFRTGAAGGEASLWMAAAARLPRLARLELCVAEGEDGGACFRGPRFEGPGRGRACAALVREWLRPCARLEHLRLSMAGFGLGLDQVVAAAAEGLAVQTSLTSLAMGWGDAHGLPADTASAARALAGLRRLPALRSLALELAPFAAAPDSELPPVAPPLGALLAALPELRGACPALAAVSVKLRRPRDGADAAAAEACVEAARAANPEPRISFEFCS